MTPDRQAKLYAQYPDLFQDGSLPARESCMGRGICFDDGWYDLMDQLCARLTLLKAHTGLGIVFTQLKEKMSGLRVYYRIDAFPPDSTHEEQCHWARIIDALISQADNQAAQTCEVSGKWGDLHTKGGWLKTLHPDEAAKMGFTKVEGRG
jgi:hypothetical protein